MIVISGRSHPQLAKEIGVGLSCEVIHPVIREYADLEFHLQIQGKLDNRLILIVQSLCTPVERNLLELLFLVDAAKRLGAAQIKVLIPYLGYSRQNKVMETGCSCGVEIIARTLSSAPIDLLLIGEIHDLSSLNYFTIPTHHVRLADTLIPSMECLEADVVICPDQGGMERSNYIANLLDIPLIQMSKTRINGSIIVELPKNVANKKCLIYDDMIDSGATMNCVAKKLKEKGALKVFAYASHGIFADKSQPSWTHYLDKVVITDSISQIISNNKIEIKSIANLIIKILKEVMN